ncbi:hypothetical protein QTH97_26090 [Variovorax sp. J22R24]|uniref:hypothetical protein n=1 Tax=Variovorax gracilis TaxID=3053502 RepID=UPI0025754743|nr:hypothetical protein [Variovorax sp. J22R24]MDM0108446.1 hypothetical protein [Variovorax sp. J22R24]
MRIARPSNLFNLPPSGPALSLLSLLRRRDPSTIYKVIRQFEPGDITSVYDVWAGSINAETDGFCGHCIASFSTAPEAYRLAERLNNHQLVDCSTAHRGAPGLAATLLSTLGLAAMLYIYRRAWKTLQRTESPWNRSTNL